MSLLLWRFYGLGRSVWFFLSSLNCRFKKDAKGADAKVKNARRGFLRFSCHVPSFHVISTTARFAQKTNANPEPVCFGLDAQR